MTFSAFTLIVHFAWIITAQRYASMVYAVVMCLTICLSIKSPD